LELACIDGVSLKERAVADFIKKRLQAVKIDVEEDDTAQKTGGNCGNLIIRMCPHNHDVGSLVLMAHLDTVTSTKGLKPIQQNGLITSDGTTILGGDDRAGVALILYILEEIKTRSLRHRNFEVVFSVAEEIGLLGALNLDVSRLLSGEGYILDCSRKPGSYVTRTPTALYFRAEFIGRSAHAGVSPEKGINALSMVIEFLNNVPVGKIDDQTVANVGTIQGGTGTNVVPDKITICGEIRSLSQSRIASFQRAAEADALAIATKYGGQSTLTFSTGFEGFSLDTSVPTVKHLEDKIHLLGLTPHPLTYYGGSDANVLNQRGITAVTIGIGCNNPHSQDENIAIQDLVHSADLLMQLLSIEE